MMKRLFSGITQAVLSWWSRDVSLWVKFAAKVLEGLARLVIRVIKTSVFVTFACVLALGGALVGFIIGAMKGETIENGFLRESGAGAITGAFVVVHLLGSIANGEPLSEVAVLSSLFEGEVLMEWITRMETTNGEISDVYDSSSGVRGLSKDCIQKLAEFTLESEDSIPEFHCPICLQDFQDGDLMRKLPYCGHLFHLDCLDKWLTRNGSCPICRNYLCNDN